MNNTNGKSSGNTCTTANNNGISYTDDVKPRVSETCIPELVNRLYGLKVTEVKQLPSYYDLNFYITVEETHDNTHINSVNKDGYVLKILNAFESTLPENVDSQNALCKFLRKQDITTQISILNTEGKEWSLETFPGKNKDEVTHFGPYLVRLLTFIPGKLFIDTPYVPGSFFNIGKCVGIFHKEVQKGFHHNVSENHSSVWSFHKISVVREFTHVLECDADVKIVEEVVKAFEQDVLPKRECFTKGIIHGDLNENNMIVQEVPGQSETPIDKRVHDVYALIDFSDVSLEYTVSDVAICIVYLSMICPDEEQVDIGGHILAGYYQNYSLNNDEFDALKILMCVRLCQTLVFGAHTYTRQPDNTNVLETQKCGWPFLHKLWKIPSTQLHERWKDIIGRYQK